MKQDYRMLRSAANRQGRALALLAIAAMLVACLAGCSPASTAPSRIDSLEASDVPATPADIEESVPENPIDFAALQEQNSNAYAWLYVPDTNVNYAVLQNEIVDNYYLVHDMYGNDSVTGSIYSQAMNARDFSDPVTLIYGHTFDAGTALEDEMFGSLHRFEDPGFFDSHPNFYIYTPESILTYEVVSAYEYDDRHIMNSFDFSDPQVVQSYFDYVVNPDSMVKNVREGIALSADADKIVQLSTCTRPANDAARYLLTGRLVDERATA